jgi:hypothetical protein
MELVVASYGGGTNSTAELIECVKRKEKVDLILFADTGGERPETYKYVQMFSDWLVNHGMPGIIVVKKTDKNGQILTLEQNCLQQKALPSLAYGFKTCSQKFKIQPQEKFINNWQPAVDTWKSGNKITRLVGYDAGEERRVKIYEDKKYNNRYPLIEWDIDRDKCAQIILDAGLELPGKSSCFFCPSTKKKELLKMRKEHPELLERAFEMERNSELTVIDGLGRSYNWEKFIHAKESEFSLFCEYESDQLPCGCYD